MWKARRRPSVTANAKEAIHCQLDPDPISNTRTPKTRVTKLSSLSLKFVSLYDWWLVKAEGKGIAVGGVAYRGSLGVRAFCSTAIVKRHDTATLETADGVTITISGVINRSHTRLNGFPLEVCNHFLLGFPYYWEEYVNQFCGQQDPNRGVPSRVSCFDEVNVSSSSNANSLQPVSLDDIPVTQIRDLLIIPRGGSENNVLHREIPNVQEKAALHSRVVKRTYKSRDRTKKSTDKLTPSRGVVTRSMARLRNHANNQ